MLVSNHRCIDYHQAKETTGGLNAKIKISERLSVSAYLVTVDKPAVKQFNGLVHGIIVFI